MSGSAKNPPHLWGGGSREAADGAGYRGSPARRGDASPLHRFAVPLPASGEEFS